MGFISLSLFSFLAHNDCFKCGQTSRPFVEAKVPARCNSEASSCSCFLFCFWLIPVLDILMFLFWDIKIAKATLLVLAMLCIVTSLLSYTIIFIKLRLHQATMQPIGGGIPALKIAQFKKTLTSISLVQWALVICYIPFVILSAILLSTNSVLANSEVFYLAANLVYSTLIYLNSSLNPFLYCWRIKEVRQAVKGVFLGVAETIVG